MMLDDVPIANAQMLIRKPATAVFVQGYIGHAQQFVAGRGLPASAQHGMCPRQHFAHAEGLGQCPSIYLLKFILCLVFSRSITLFISWLILASSQPWI